MEELRSRHLFPLICTILLWRFCKVTAYVDVCESSPGTVYCNCEEQSFRDSPSLFKVNCLILQSITRYDAVWRSIGDSENISYLKLQPRLSVVELQYIPSNELKRMPNLKILRIQEGSLGTFQSQAVSEFKSLEELELQGNEIVALERHAISQMPKLKKLTLSENRLQELLADSLSDLPELESLYLDQNNISRIETCAFCQLQNLKELELWGNELSDLTEYTFRGLRYLKRLDLYKNKIRILNDKVFHTMPRLVELDLRENLIDHISPRAFYGLEKLQTLAMGSNKIKVLHEGVFAPLLNVRSVNLYKNELEVIEREVVDGIKTSKEAYFSLGFKENPYKCDCAMQWVANYLNVTKSHRFTWELQEVKCMLENESKQAVVEFLEGADCKPISSRKRAPPVDHVQVWAKSTDIVPIELNSQKSKPLSTAVAIDDGTEAYLSDVNSNKADVDDNGTNSLNIHSSLAVCLALLTLYFLS